jgi:hypothetical protein
MLSMIFGIAAIVLGAILATANWSAPFIAARTGRSVSMVPPIGGALIGTGVYFCVGSIGWALLAVCLDPGIVILFVSVPWLIYDAWSTSWFLQVHRLIHRDNERTITVDLFRSGRASLRMDFEKGRVRPDYTSEAHVPISCGLSASWRASESGFEIFDFGNDRRLTLERTDDGYAAVETGVPEGWPSYQLMNGVRFVADR